MFQERFIPGTHIPLPPGACNYKLQITGPQGQSLELGEGQTGFMGEVNIYGGGGHYIREKVKVEIIQHTSSEEDAAYARNLDMISSGYGGSAKVQTERAIFNIAGKITAGPFVEEKTLPDGSRLHLGGSGNHQATLWHDKDHWEPKKLPF